MINLYICMIEQRSYIYLYDGGWSLDNLIISMLVRIFLEFQFFEKLSTDKFITRLNKYIYNDQRTEKLTVTINQNNR